MDSNQLSFTDIEYSGRKRVTKREEFLQMMDEIIPWDEYVEIVRPVYFDNKRGRPPRGIETMLRMYFLSCWFNLSDEGVEDMIYDSYAFRAFMKLDFANEQAPDATTLCKFRHLLEENGIGKMLFDAVINFLEDNGRIMHGGTIVDATLIAAPPSTKNSAGQRDPQMHQSRKGNQWFFGMKAHTGVDAGSGYVHSLEVSAGNVTDIEMAHCLIREDDDVMYGDSGYVGIEKRGEIKSDEHLKNVTYKVNKRKGSVRNRVEKQMETRKSSIRSKVEHPYLIIKQKFGYAKVRYRGLAKNLCRLQTLFASANLVMLARSVRRECEMMGREWSPGAVCAL